MLKNYIETNVPTNSSYDIKKRQQLGPNEEKTNRNATKYKKMRANLANIHLNVSHNYQPFLIPILSDTVSVSVSVYVQHIPLYHSW